MNWIVLAVIVAFIGAVVSGRVPIEWLVYSFSAFFLLWGLALGFAYSRTKHHGLLLMGLTYGAAAILAVILTHWWPLIAGFAIAWIMRAMGMDPGPGVVPENKEGGDSP